MAKIIVNLVTAPKAFPAGTVAGLFRVSLVDAAGGIAFLEGDGVGYTFDDVAPGVYNVIAERFDASGVGLGNPIAKPITVTAAQVEIAVPVDFTAAVA